MNYTKKHLYECIEIIKILDDAIIEKMVEIISEIKKNRFHLSFLKNKDKKKQEIIQTIGFRQMAKILDIMKNIIERRFIVKMLANLVPQVAWL
jgi:uncharacterized protein YjgD (DUF1641 family)